MELGILRKLALGSDTRIVDKSMLALHYKSIWIVISALSLLAGCDTADNQDFIARQGAMIVYNHLRVVVVQNG